MKINDVLVNEVSFADAYAMRNAPGGPPRVDTTKPAAPAAPAAMAKWPTTPNEIKAFQSQNKLKADGLIGKKTFDALTKAGAVPPKGFQPVGPKTKSNAPTKAPATATAPADQATDAQTQTSNYTGVDQRTANARDADAAPPAGGYANAEPEQPSQTGTDINRLAQLAGTMRRDTPPPNVNALGVAAQSGPGFGQQAATSDKPNTQTGQAAQAIPPGLASATTPQGNTSIPAGPTATANPDGTGDGTTSGQAAQPVKDPTVAPPVATGKDGTGPGLKDGSGKAVTSSSDDELAWVAKNGGSLANRGMYPGPGNWDPKTGRTTNAADKALAASGANPWDGKDPAKAAAWAALSPEDQKWIGKGDPTDKFILARAPSKGGFLGSLGFGNKSSSGQAAQPASGDQTGGSTTGNKAFLPGVAGGAKEDIEILRKLSGL